jgi:predicted chitinase
MNLIPTYNLSLSKILLQKIKTLLLLVVFTVSSFNVFTQNSSLISTCSEFVAGPNTTWPHVLVATTIDSGAASQGSQTFTMNVTSLPAGGANFRVYKTVANGNDFFGNPIALTLGPNTITVAAVSFDRAVKFQFSSGDVEFNALSMNGDNSECVVVVPPSTSSLISTCSEFVAGPNTTWPHVLVATTIADGSASQGAQTFTMNVTSLPAGGANFRVYKTTANGNDFFGNPIALTLGPNTITVAAVSFDRAVKFQFSSGDVEFNALSMNGDDSECIANPNTTKITENHVFINTFPNPSNGDLFIESNEPIELLEIKELSGRVVLEIVPHKSKVHIQTSQLKSSFYVLSCLIKQEWVSKKIIFNQK